MFVWENHITLFNYHSNKSTILIIIAHFSDFRSREVKVWIPGPHQRSSGMMDAALFACLRWREFNPAFFYDALFLLRRFYQWGRTLSAVLLRRWWERKKKKVKIEEEGRGWGFLRGRKDGSKKKKKAARPWQLELYLLSKSSPGETTWHFITSELKYFLGHFTLLVGQNKPPPPTHPHPPRCHRLVEVKPQRWCWVNSLLANKNAHS